ncbi:hypothetical protein JQ633_04985 [Bradyrhizobium tropiciagri]|uniref:DUF6916 family protein n=1 Tax=Bradyrhizobium tropiciagri TaxID=312253 RepID=UPI001BA92FAE|nr:hypothetical protein [Bradyrhizobium tropiciagri]MBR0869704.1 hypothetical protein [Bradyrhizobium tropiciagri]
MTSSVDLAKLHIDDFAPHQEAVFELQTAQGILPLKLAEVGPAGESGREGGAFALLFTSPQGPWLPQAIYPVRHPVLGVMEIFLVPVGPTAGGNGYHATFA